MDEIINVTVESGDKPVRIFMLGEFRISVGDRVVTDNLNRSHMMWNLLAYLVVHRDRNIPQNEFVDVLWPGETDNSSSALKTLLYRTRLTLAPILGEDVQLILSQRGSYSWNRNLKCTVDAEVFEKLCHEAENEKNDEDQRMEYYRKALPLYKGVFLPKLSGQLWLRPIALHYHNLFLSAVKGFADLLIARGLYEELADLCRSALDIDMYDEQLHTLMVLSYLKLGEFAQALRQYETATEILYRNLGVQPSKDLQDLYLEIMRGQKGIEVDLSVIQKDMSEEDDGQGAFVVEPGFFKEAYRLEVRRAPRQGISAYLALMTVSTPEGEIPPLDTLNKTMDQLLVSITQTLRKGDIVSRYSGAQYVFLLPTADFENADMVMKRIMRTFNRQNPRNKLHIAYKLRQIELSL